MFKSELTPFDHDTNQRPCLRLLLHSRSLGHQLLANDVHTSALLGLYHFDFIDLLITPTADLAVLRHLANCGVKCAQVECCNDYWILNEPNGQRGIGPIQSNIDYTESVIPKSHVTWLDFIMARNLEIDYFIVDPEDPFCDSNASRDTDVSPEEALARVRILAVNSGLFYVTPDFRVNEGFYFLYRFKKIFRSFQKAYTTTMFLETIPIAAREQLDSLAQRLEFICRAADNTSYYALKRANNDNQDRALYNAAFLVMLVTGIFDDLAWLIAHMYSMKINNLAMPFTQPTHCQRSICLI